MKKKELKELVSFGDRVLLACSGGPDSIFLVETFLNVSKSLGLEIGVAHVDHGLRGEASVQDARFVAQYCKEKSVPFFLRELHLAGQKAPHGIEELARRRRYESLFDICRQHGFQKVATAHHRDDQFETVLLRILQKAPRRHWTGMKWSRPLGKATGVSLIRPLLSISKKEILDWLDQGRVPYRLDETNQSKRFLRNQLRHRMNRLPKGKQDELKESVLRLCQQAQELRSIELRLQALVVARFGRRFDRSFVLQNAPGHEWPVFFLEDLFEQEFRRLGSEAPQGTVQAAVRTFQSGKTGNRVLDPSGMELRKFKTGIEILATQPC